MSEFERPLALLEFYFFIFFVVELINWPRGEQPNKNTIKMKLGEVSRVAGTLKNNKHVSDIFINKQTPNQWTN